MPRVALISLLLTLGAAVPSRAQAPSQPAPSQPAPPQDRSQDPDDGLQPPPKPSPPPLPGTTRFKNRRGTFQIDLPESWRQLAPGEAILLREKHPTMPPDLLHNEPAYHYAVGPVDDWLAGEFDGRYLYVVEQDNEWIIDEEFADRLQQMWDDMGGFHGVDYRVEQIDEATIGRNDHPATVCRRRSTPREDAPDGVRRDRAQLSLDVYAPTGGRQVSLTLTCWADEFPERESEFRTMMQTITFARRATGTKTLGDRLWTPIITGSVVGLVLLVLYKWTRRRPPGPLPGGRPHGGTHPRG